MASLKTFVFIESNTTGTGELYIERALQKGYKIYFLTNQLNRYPYLKKYKINVTLIDTHNKNKLLSFVRNLKNVKGIFSSSEYYIHIASAVATELGLLSASVNAIHRCRDKYKLFQSLSAAGVSSPATVLLRSTAEITASLQKFSFPVICKPCFGTGSMGVKLCHNEQEFRDHISSLFLQPSDSRETNNNKLILAQAYIRGDEYSVEVLGDGEEHHILGITQKYLGNEPYFVEIGHDFPASLPSKLETQIISTVKKALKAVGLMRGPAHIELRIRNNQIYIIEINPRLAGGMIPALIEESFEINLLASILDLYTGNFRKPVLKRKNYSCIRFFISSQEGVLTNIENTVPSGLQQKIRYLAINKKAGDTIHLTGDYRDRLGYVVVSAPTIEICHKYLEEIFDHIKFHIHPSSTQNALENTGRLKSTLLPEALTIVNKTLSEVTLREDLQHLITLDHAHLLMLLSATLIKKADAQKILRASLALKKEASLHLNPEELSRGLYMWYENYLIQAVGENIAGNIHLGRSRNDINATLFKLKLRKSLVKAYGALTTLRSTLLEKAKDSLDIAMPIYSQYQVALPGTYSYYLAALEAAFARSHEGFKNLLPELNTSPLGAAAGAGSTFPINPALSAKLLGFQHTSSNALDAVANRDLALRFLSEISILCTTVSRIAQDFQLWTTQEFGLFELPDNLVGGSSMLPQKRNPFLLEKIKGLSAHTIGKLGAMFAVMQKVPFSNSYEISTEAAKEIANAVEDFGDSCTLLQLILKHAKPNPYAMERSQKHGLSMATNAIDYLIKEKNYAFRDAHHKIGEIIHAALATQRDPYTALLNLMEKDPHDKENFLDYAQDFKYGQGPGQTTLTSLQQSLKKLEQDKQWFASHQKIWQNADTLLNKQLLTLLGEAKNASTIN